MARPRFRAGLCCGSDGTLACAPPSRVSRRQRSGAVAIKRQALIATSDAQTPVLSTLRSLSSVHGAAHVPADFNYAVVRLESRSADEQPDGAHDERIEEPVRIVDWMHSRPAAGRDFPPVHDILRLDEHTRYASK